LLCARETSLGDRSTTGGGGIRAARGGKREEQQNTAEHRGQDGIGEREGEGEGERSVPRGILGSFQREKEKAAARRAKDRKRR